LEYIIASARKRQDKSPCACNNTQQLEDLFMAMKMTFANFGGKKEFLATVDHYVAFGHKAPKADAEHVGLTTLVNGRYILKAGTIWRDADQKAIGIVADDYDLTDGDAQVAVVVHGFVNRAKLPSAPSYADERAMAHIKFVDGDEPEEAASDYAEYYYVDIPTVANATITISTGSRRITPKGGSFAFSVTAAEGHAVSAVAANGTSLTAVEGVYTISDIDADQAITVTVS
jgi:hypothetical protein